LDGITEKAGSGSDDVSPEPEVGSESAFFVEDVKVYLRKIPAERIPVRVGQDDRKDPSEQSRDTD
jgi:hypothetical protein